MQAKQVFAGLIAFGQSKQQVKQAAGAEWDRTHPEGITKQQYINNALRDKIYSYKTYKNYAKQNNYFFRWCRDNYKCKTLAQCREHVNEYLQSRIDSGYAAHTIKLQAAALAKLYQCSSAEFIATPARHRANIVRSRGTAARDRNFSAKRNKDLIDFCMGTGLRRSELKILRPEQLRETENGYYLVIKGKGGKVREAPIIGQNVAEIVQKIKNTQPGQKVWSKIHSCADIHNYRALYATQIYKMHARAPEKIPKKDKYFCKKDLQGVLLDKQAMLAASNALGHNRIDVVANNYIRL